MTLTMAAQSSFGQGNADTTRIKSLLEEAYFYDEGSSSFLPLITKDQFHGNTIHFELIKTNASNLLLQIKANQPIAIFINKKLITVTNTAKHRFWPTDSLFKEYGDQLQFTLYNRHLSLKELSVTLFTISSQLGEDLEASENIVILNQRNTSGVFNNFLILGLLILLTYLATLYNYYPRVTVDFLRIRRALAFREMDENLLKSRAFSWINILFYIFFSLLAGYLLVCVFYLAPFELIENFETTQLAIWFWVKVSGAVLLWLLIKYTVLSNFTTLFNIKGFLPSHFFNYIRLGLFIFLVATSLLVLSYLGFEIKSETYYRSFFNLLLIAVSGRTVFILFKLMNSASYKFLHLFSYLCGTEIIPLGMILFLGLNQPF